MRLLLDECVPRKLKSLFVAAGHDCETAREAGYGGLTNGELLAQAELLFDVLQRESKLRAILSAGEIQQRLITKGPRSLWSKGFR